MQFAYLMFIIQKFGIVCIDANKGVILFSIVFRIVVIKGH